MISLIFIFFFFLFSLAATDALKVRASPKVLPLDSCPAEPGSERRKKNINLHTGTGTSCGALAVTNSRFSFLDSWLLGFSYGSLGPALSQFENFEKLRFVTQSKRLSTACWERHSNAFSAGCNFRVLPVLHSGYSLQQKIYKSFLIKRKSEDVLRHLVLYFFNKIIFCKIYLWSEILGDRSPLCLVASRSFRAISCLYPQNRWSFYKRFWATWRSPAPPTRPSKNPKSRP